MRIWSRATVRVCVRQGIFVVGSSDGSFRNLPANETLSNATRAGEFDLDQACNQPLTMLVWGIITCSS
jgi:hypothetical protein